MIDLKNVYNSKAVAVYNKPEKSNAIPYLGQAFFPNKRKASIDLKWIKTSSGLPVTLAASNFDAQSTIRTRKGFNFDAQEMAFFRESIMVSEKDRIELMKISETDSPFLKDVLANIFDDTKTLVDGADVVPERMRMQLLFPTSGGPSISIASKGVTYAYNYDANGHWAANNRTDLSGTRQWCNHATAKPLTDIQTIVENADTPIKYLIMSQATFNMLMDCDQVKQAILAQNPTANIFMNTSLVKQVIANMFPGVEVLIYKKKVKETDGTDIKLAPDGYVALLPEGTLGNTWFGMTPEEISLVGDPTVDVTILESGVAVCVKHEYGPPVKTETTVAETVLPSYERMDDVYLLGVGTASNSGSELDNLTVTVSEGTASGKTKFAISETLGAGHSYKIKAYNGNATIPNYGQNLKTWTAYTEGEDFATTNGYEVVVAEVDADYKVVAAAVVIADCKA